MTNPWNFKLLIDPWTGLIPESLERMALVAAAAGFSPICPDTGTIIVNVFDYASYDIARYELHAIAEAAGVMARPGSTLVLWGHDTTINLSLDPTGKAHANSGISPDLNDTPAFGHISFWVLESDLCRDLENRETFEQAVRQMFERLGQEFDATYGYAVDDYALEHFMSEMRVQARTKRREPPAPLFWLNYISDDYMRQVGVKRLQGVGAKVERAGSGYVVSVTPHAWEADSALIPMNQAWMAAIQKR